MQLSHRVRAAVSTRAYHPRQHLPTVVMLCEDHQLASSLNISPHCSIPREGDVEAAGKRLGSSCLAIFGLPVKLSPRAFPPGFKFKPSFGKRPASCPIYLFLRQRTVQAVTGSRCMRAILPCSTAETGAVRPRLFQQPIVFWVLDLQC